MDVKILAFLYNCVIIWEKEKVVILGFLLRHKRVVYGIVFLIFLDNNFLVYKNTQKCMGVPSEL